MRVTLGGRVRLKQSFGATLKKKMPIKKKTCDGGVGVGGSSRRTTMLRSRFGKCVGVSHHLLLLVVFILPSLLLIAYCIMDSVVLK